jgi:hypothetical protein
MRWHYGITTVTGRDKLLRQTIESLRLAGFERPCLFLDGTPGDFWCPTTAHYRPVKTAANWFLSLAELYFREPNCDAYALFQDDILAVRNLRQYLEQTIVNVNWKPYFLNLYTLMLNEEERPEGYQGWYPAPRQGRGAQALVFDREGLITCLTARSFYERVQNQEPCLENGKPVGDWLKGQKSVDGAIVTAMLKAGYKEVLHYPSLIQHASPTESSMCNRLIHTAPSFPGEEFDALSLLEQTK